MKKLKSRKIAIFTTSRADFGLLREFVKKINFDKNFRSYLIVSGSHLEKKSGFTINEIIQSKLKIYAKININVSNDQPKSIAKSISIGMIKFTNLLEKLKPELIVVLGDRFELIPICYSSTLLNIPIVHFNGGESSEGSIDEVTRHCISKLSHIHFATTTLYRQKLINMGENPKKVFNVGSLSVENVKSSCSLSREKISTILKIKKNNNFFLITYHPSTLEIKKSINEIKNLIKAITKFKNFNYIFTGTNNDPRASDIKKLIKNFVRKNKNARYFSSLGSKIYTSSMKYCSCVIGNSSSGILEAPILKKPVVNIGSRQQGRIKSNNIINVNEQTAKIYKAIKTTQSKAFKRKLKLVKNPFGNGKTSRDAVNILKRLKIKDLLLKKFYFSK